METLLLFTVVLLALCLILGLSVSCKKSGTTSTNTTTSATTQQTPTTAVATTATSTTTTATTPSGPLKIAHSIKGHEACLGCHATGLMNSPKVPADHAAYTNDLCQTCHVPL
jgi:hypothetical protein